MFLFLIYIIIILTKISNLTKNNSIIVFSAEFIKKLNKYNNLFAI